VQREDGSQGIYTVVDKPPMAIILAMDGTSTGMAADTGVWLVEQYRYTLGRRVWELPQGAFETDPGITAEALARQELREETGLRAGRVEELPMLYVASGFCSQQMHAFVATELTQGETERESTEQDMVVARFPLAEFEEMLRSGAIVDSLTHATYGMWLLRKG